MPPQEYSCDDQISNYSGPVTDIQKYDFNLVLLLRSPLLMPTSLSLFFFLSPLSRYRSWKLVTSRSLNPPIDEKGWLHPRETAFWRINKCTQRSDYSVTSRKHLYRLWTKGIARKKLALTNIMSDNSSILVTIQYLFEKN